jgi:hypothetical protein
VNTFIPVIAAPFLIALVGVAGVGGTYSVLPDRGTGKKEPGSKQVRTVVVFDQQLLPKLETP